LRFQICTLAAFSAFILHLVLKDRLGHPVTVSMVCRYIYRSEATIRFKNPNYVKVLADAALARATGTMAPGDTRFPTVPPKALKREGT
jgi:hypothetical protein